MDSFVYMFTWVTDWRSWYYARKQQCIPYEFSSTVAEKVIMKMKMKLFKYDGLRKLHEKIDEMSIWDELLKHWFTSEAWTCSTSNKASYYE